MRDQDEGIQRRKWLIRHREDGPASNMLMVPNFGIGMDNRHREDGPAIEYADGTKFGIGMVNFIEKMVQLSKWLMVPKLGFTWTKN
jgi:hypothetical protein